MELGCLGEVFEMLVVAKHPKHLSGHLAWHRKGSKVFSGGADSLIVARQWRLAAR
jgi:hypothetical protein